MFYCCVLLQIAEDATLDSMTEDSEVAEKSSMNSIHLEVNNTDTQLQTWSVPPPRATLGSGMVQKCRVSAMGLSN